MASVNSFSCVCGFKGNSGHSGRCPDYQAEIQRVKENMKSYISDYYLKTYSISGCCEYVVAQENSGIKPSALRKTITEYLDSINIRESFNGENFNKHRQIKIQAAIFKNHGVINAGQMPGNGFKAQNQIPYTKLKVNEDYDKYRKEVDSLTWKQFGKLKKSMKVPDSCYYTGLKFNDNVLDKVNPNDPLKRTIDHKISVTEAFFCNWPPEKTAAEENLVFCLRIVNTIKGHASEEEFKKILLPRLKERLNEN